MTCQATRATFDRTIVGTALVTVTGNVAFLAARVTFDRRTTVIVGTTLGTVTGNVTRFIAFIAGLFLLGLLATSGLGIDKLRALHMLRSNQRSKIKAFEVQVIPGVRPIRLFEYRKVSKKKVPMQLSLEQDFSVNVPEL